MPPPPCVHLINNSQNWRSRRRSSTAGHCREREKGEQKKQEQLASCGAKFLATSVAGCVVFLQAGAECINFKRTLLCINASHGWEACRVINNVKSKCQQQQQAQQRNNNNKARAGKRTLGV